MQPVRHGDVRPVPRPGFVGIHVGPSLLTIEAWVTSEIKAISPLVDKLMRLIEGSRCVAGNEFGIEMALREALSNAVIHGSGMDAHKLVEVRCRCERGKGVWLTVKDQGKGFDPNAVPDPLAPECLEAEHGRGIHLMKLAMDQVSFESGGTEVHMWKRAMNDTRTELKTPNESANRMSKSNPQHGVSVDGMQANAVGKGPRQAA